MKTKFLIARRLLLPALLITGNFQPTPTFAQGALPDDIRKCLILHFDFDGVAVDGKAADKSGHGNVGQIVNVVFVKDGHQGGAAKFALSDSYITVPNNDEINPRRLTVAAWIKTSYSDKVWRRIFDKCYSKGFALSEGGDVKQWHHKGLLEWETGVGAGGLSGQRIDDGQWHHVVATYDGVDAKIYMDGWPAGKPAHKVGELKRNDYDLTIGANRSNPDGAYGEIGASFNGMMDDVMMFNRALSDDEVQTLFKAQGGVLAAQLSQSAPAAGSQNKPDAAERLKKLQSLYDQGLINKDDYEKKKKEIVDSL
jgi:hypothetical protein